MPTNHPTHGRPIAVVREYSDLVATLKRRRVSLGLTCLHVDDRAGLHTGYTTKLENFAGSQGKVLGPVSMPLILGALGLAIAIVECGPRPRAATADPRQLELDLIGGDVTRQVTLMRRPKPRSRVRCDLLNRVIQSPPIAPAGRARA